MRPDSVTAARPSRPAPSVRPPAAGNPAPFRVAPASVPGAVSSSTPSSSAPRTAPPGASSAPAAPGAKPAAATPPGEQKILFQKFFKSVGPRTYAAQVKEANNGNHFLVVTEGKRDDATGEVRKTRLFVFSEDFAEFFDLLEQTARFIKAHPVPPEVEQRRRRFWARKNGQPAPDGPSK